MKPPDFVPRIQDAKQIIKNKNVQITCKKYLYTYCVILLIY